MFQQVKWEGCGWEGAGGREDLQRPEQLHDAVGVPRQLVHLAAQQQNLAERSATPQH